MRKRPPGPNKFSSLSARLISHPSPDGHARLRPLDRPGCSDCFCSLCFGTFSPHVMLAHQLWSERASFSFLMEHLSCYFCLMDKHTRQVQALTATAHVKLPKGLSYTRESLLLISDNGIMASLLGRLRAWWPREAKSWKSITRDGHENPWYKGRVKEVQTVTSPTTDELQGLEWP